MIVSSGLLAFPAVLISCFLSGGLGHPSILQVRRKVNPTAKHEEVMVEHGTL